MHYQLLFPTDPSLQSILRILRFDKYIWRERKEEEERYRATEKSLRSSGSFSFRPALPRCKAV